MNILQEQFVAPYCNSLMLDESRWYFHDKQGHALTEADLNSIRIRFGRLGFRSVVWSGHFFSLSGYTGKE